MHQSYKTYCGKQVLIYRKPSIKKLVLSFSKKQKNFVVSAPYFVPFSSIVDFINNARDWFAKIELMQSQEPSFNPVEPGQCLSILGDKFSVVFIENCQEKVVFNGTTLEVHGIRSKFQKILLKHLKTLAFEKFSYYSRMYAQILSVKYARIAIKDTKTRFGSCSSLGQLNYCWRVVMAPEQVLAYLCAHEVSHLKEMNHSKAFWLNVEKLCPNYRSLQNWLKQNGKELLSVNI